MATSLGIRWTIGDVSLRGFEALKLSIHGAFRVFGPAAAYVVYVNSIALEEARRRTGPVPEQTQWREAPREVAPTLRRHLGAGMADGVAWKFLPLSAFADRCELALDNDVILWSEPKAVRRWLTDSAQACLVAEDVAAGHGAFAQLCGPEPRNSGIRGTPAGFDLERALGRVLSRLPAQLDSELDEQGMQIAALSLDRPPLYVTTREVTICSPFYPHQGHLGSCGAHFVGLNARELPWRYYDRPATELRIEHWQEHLPELYRRVGLSPAMV
ncbi:MAG: hypothetical protein JWN85_804 [Gammaproteobacteria bacterium]|nr:hypothetical protein [Gammaproteobacteria bacterium]